MSHIAEPGASFFQTLFELDRQAAEAVREEGCPCGGRLHAAHYLRKPRGPNLPEDPAFRTRFSFCCAEDGCRKRRMPPSLRFLDRMVYLSIVVVLAAAWRQGPTPRRMRFICGRLQVSPRLVQRWLRWWEDHFKLSRRWVALRARFLAGDDPPPRAMLECAGTENSTDARLGVLRALADPA